MESFSLSSVFGFLFLKLNLKKITAANIIKYNSTDKTYCTLKNPGYVYSMKMSTSEFSPFPFQLRDYQYSPWKKMPVNILPRDEEKTLMLLLIGSSFIQQLFLTLIQLVLLHLKTLCGKAVPSLSQTRKHHQYFSNSKKGIIS